jgi:hypothetical protein
MKHAWNDDWIRKNFIKEKTTKLLHERYINECGDDVTYDMFKWHVRVVIGLSRPKLKMTLEQERFIQDNFDSMSCEALRESFNKRFLQHIKPSAFYYHAHRLGLRKNERHDYSDKEEMFLQDNAPRMTRAELTSAFNSEFGLSVDEQAISVRCWLKGYGANGDGKFQKGRPPWAKMEGGREAFCEAHKGGNSGSFKKGHVPQNTLPEGAVRQWGDEVVIKTHDGMKAKPRYIWEQEYGQIPKGNVIIAVDGDRSTDDIQNLRMISKKEQNTLMANRWNGKGALIIDTGVMYARLRELIDGGD